MSQIVSASFAAQNASGSKALDFAFVIAGWPTVYTVARGDYTLAGDFANFSSVEPWADLPVAVGSAPRGIPEGGNVSIGEMEITIVDRRAAGRRSISDLIARQSYVELPGVGIRALTTLNDYTFADDYDDSQIPVSSVPTVPSSKLIYIGLECIHWNGAFAHSPKQRFPNAPLYCLTGCTRGYLGTSKTGHLQGVEVFGDMPSLFMRRAYLYKGYQGLGMDQWAKAFCGVVAGVRKNGSAVTFRVMSTTWVAHNDGRALCLRPRPPNGYVDQYSDNPLYDTFQVNTDFLEGDSTLECQLPPSNQFSNTTAGTYLLKAQKHLMAIKGVS